jgi:hypothetical protein
MDRSARLALLAFALVAVVAFGLFLGFGQRQWFFVDEWDFLADRDASNLGDLLRPHNEHWSTLSILLYRALYGLFGLRTYVPYQLVSILLHLTAALLLWFIMRRAGVRPWIATAAASSFALFGAGKQDIVWAFQMAWGASLVFGLTQLLLADHDGPLDRRDWIGLSAGFAGLMCSGIAVTMTIIVGLAMVIRRGWRIALFHTAPLGVVYVVWLVTAARDTQKPGGSVDLLARWVVTGLGATFDAMGQVPGAGIALGLLLVVGLVLAWHGLDPRELRRRAAVPGALLVGVIVFLVISGLGRVSAFGPELARSSRYLHLVAALALPAVAVGADAVARQWRVLAPAVFALLLIGIPGNLRILASNPRQVHELPSWVTLRSSLHQSEQQTTAAGCQIVDAGVSRRLDKGQSLQIKEGRVRVFDHAAGAGPFDYATYDPADGHTLTALKGPLTLSLVVDDRAQPVTVCGGSTPSPAARAAPTSRDATVLVTNYPPCEGFTRRGGWAASSLGSGVRDVGQCRRSAPTL